jgi:hypothetical protein
MSHFLSLLESLNLSETSQDREIFLSEAYHLQEESGHVDDEEEEMMNKEIEGVVFECSPSSCRLCNYLIAVIKPVAHAHFFMLQTHYVMQDIGQTITKKLMYIYHHLLESVT